MSDIVIGNGGLHQLVNKGLDSINDYTKNLQELMAKFDASATEDKNKALIEIQFAMGQYNAAIELTTNIIKSISDTAKSISQKV